MKYCRVSPSSEIADYVRYCWIGEAEASDAHPFLHAAVATGNAKLVFHYGARFMQLFTSGVSAVSFQSGLQAQSSGHTKFIASSRVGIVGIEFTPWAIPVLFGVSADSISGSFLDIHTLLGAEGSMLEQQVMDATDNTERIGIITAFLARRAKYSSINMVKDAVQKMIRQRGLLAPGTLHLPYNISQRQFERQFKQNTGFSPRAFSRVLRFEAAVAQMHSHHSLTTIALDCGYYDQAHFIHDFKTLSGYLPKDYRNMIQQLPVASC